MNLLSNRTVVVAGGTGNVGGFIVRGALDRGATVVVPSRSERKIDDLKQYLNDHLEAAARTRLKTFVGTISDEVDGPALVERIVREVGAPDGVVSLMGGFRAADSVLEATEEDFDYVLRHYLKAHHGVARALLPALRERGGTYVFINGPLAFKAWPGSSLVSIATAAQHMLFEVLAKECEDDPVRITELVTHAYIRDRQTQPGSPIPGEAVGAFAAHLVSQTSGDIHGASTHLRSLDQLEEVGLSITATQEH